MNLRTRETSSSDSPAVTSIDVTVLATLFDHAPEVAFFVKDAQGRYVSVNDSLAKRHGMSAKSDVIGRRPSEICIGDFGRVPAQQDLQVLQTGRPLLEHLEMHWNRPNQPVWCLTTKLPISDASGRVSGLVGFSRDVSVPIAKDEIPEQFAAALEQFERTLSGDVTPAWLARQSDLTPQQLARFMKRVFGLTPTQFITKIRIAAASRLLLGSERSVAEIAVACGYYDHSAFTRAFRSATGVAPSVFRKRNDSEC